MKRKPIAWYYEIAGMYNPDTKEYTAWKKQLSFDQPFNNAPGIRNITPLYRLERIELYRLEKLKS